MDGRMDGWMDGWPEGIDGYIDRWMDRDKERKTFCKLNQKRRRVEVGRRARERKGKTV